MTQRKYRPGPAIRDIGEVVRLLYEGHWFYWPSAPKRPKHPSIFTSMTLHTLEQAAVYGRLRLAVKIETESEKEQTHGEIESQDT